MPDYDARMNLGLAPTLVLLVACGGAAPEAAAPGLQPAALAAAKLLVNVDAEGVGLGGHDPTSYADGKPSLGAARVTSQHGGATYHFVTADAQARFDDSPATYAPAYGGYCAYAAAENRLSPADPTQFLGYEGNLLVFTNAEFLERFLRDPAGNRAKADANWPVLVEQHGVAR